MTRPIDFRHHSIDTAELAATDAVFHLAGIAHQDAPVADYEAVNFRATVELARRAHSAGVATFVFLSSVKAMGPPPDGHARSEADCGLPQDAYGHSKWQAESALNREFGEADAATVIIRPALVYGPRAKGNLAALARAVDLGLPQPPDLGARSMIGVNDLCELMRVLAREAQMGVSTYIATDGERYSVQRIFRALRSAQGRAPAGHWCPQWVWRAATAAMDTVSTSAAAQSTWDKLFGTELYSNSHVLRASSWRPTQQLENTLSTEGRAV